MTEHESRSPDRTWICGRPVEAFNASGDTVAIDLRCERLGPPARAVSSPGTSFLVTLRYTAPEGTRRDTPESAGEAAGREVTVAAEAASLWDALAAARGDLDARGWLLPIAAARVDRWCVYAGRRAGVGVVHPFDDVDTAEGILTPAPRDTIGTVAAQRHAYRRWQAEQATRPATARGNRP
jgi:hypothetical protein